MASNSNQPRAIAAVACGHLAVVSGAGCSPETPLPQPRSFASQIGDGTLLSAEATCLGVGRSPLLQWRAPEDGYVAGVVWSGKHPARVVHWLFWDQPSGPAGIGPGVRPGQHPPAQGVNSRGTIGWSAPCPPDPAVVGPSVTLDLWWMPEPLHLPPTIREADLRDRAGAVAQGTSSASVAAGER